MFELLTRESLGFEAGDAPFSGINADGTPWQFCVSLASEPGIDGVRYLTEVGVPGTTLRDRLALTSVRLREVFSRLGYSAEDDAVAETLIGLAPERESVGEVGGVWTAVAFIGDQVRLRVYANIGWGDLSERWTRLTDALRRLGAGGFAMALRALGPALSRNFVPAGLAVTFPTSPLLLKLYLRPTTEPWRSSLALCDAAGAIDFASLLQTLPSLMGSDLNMLGATAVLPSLAGESAGGPLDVKVDLCGHCLFASRRDPGPAVESICNTFGVDAAQYRRLTEALGGAGDASPVHAFVGIGAHPRKGPRVNVYIAPTVRNQARITLAVARATTWLLAQQRNAIWSDYTLPVGCATSWTTAYVVNAVLDAAALLRTVDIQPALVIACEQLERYARPEGWGFNESVETDADSSALAVFALARMKRAVDASFLFRFRNEVGGFGTFQRDDPMDFWGAMHADVAPTVFLALRAAGISFDEQALACIQSLTWQSYWWRTDLYAAAAVTRLLGSGFLRPFRPADPADGAFGLALELLVRSFAKSRSLADPLFDALICKQFPDGSWPASSWLRVTDPASPPASPTGRLYCDTGVFTTATVISALAAYSNL